MKVNIFTSIISNIESGSKAPGPTFCIAQILLLPFTDTRSWARQQASSWRLASTTWRWPICNKNGKLTYGWDERPKQVELGFTAQSYLENCYSFQHYGRFPWNNNLVNGHYTLLMVTVTGIELTSSLLQSWGSSDISSSTSPSSVDTVTFGILRKKINSRAGTTCIF